MCARSASFDLTAQQRARIHEKLRDLGLRFDADSGSILPVAAGRAAR